MSTPEVLDMGDASAHLTDAQLTAPMSGVLAGCQVPWNAKVSIRTAVQSGRAIGVTVDVRIARPTPRKPPSKKAALAMAKVDAKIIARVSACVDKNVRGLVWPPSRRRDSIMTDF